MKFHLIFVQIRTFRQLTFWQVTLLQSNFKIDREGGKTKTKGKRDRETNIQKDR
jgi:hypothetical protein